MNDIFPEVSYIGNTTNVSNPFLIHNNVIKLQETTSNIDINVWTNDDEDVNYNISDEEESENECQLALPETRISYSQAIQSLNVTLQFAIEKDLPYEEIAMLRNIREKAVLANVRESKQTLISSYFTKN